MNKEINQSHLYNTSLQSRMHGSGKERNRLKVCVIKAVQAELSENALSKMLLEPRSSVEHPVR